VVHIKNVHCVSLPKFGIVNYLDLSRFLADFFTLTEALYSRRYVLQSLIFVDLEARDASRKVAEHNSSWLVALFHRSS
jgi:hypothetical protein